MKIDSAKKISESILFTDVSVGPKLPPQLVRAAMLIRANMLLQGVSAVKQKDIEVFITLLNKNITPIVGSYGSLGASGDLAQNCRVLSAAMHKEHVKVDAPGVGVHKLIRDGMNDWYPGVLEPLRRRLANLKALIQKRL
jgi:histidine ammonia-lyase